MIVDRIENAHVYYGLGPRIKKALQYLESAAYQGLQPGRHEISGSDLVALVQCYQTVEHKDCFEAHRRYADIQYVTSGVELIGVADIHQVKPGDYDDEKDYLSATGNACFVPLPAGAFMILFPQDAHMPGIAAPKPEEVKKVVMKVLLD